MLFQKIKEQNNGNKKEIDRNKKERKRSHDIRIPSSPIVGIYKNIFRSKIFSEKASFCALQKICRKASLAVETALVLPLFFLGIVTLISFMDIYSLQTQHLQALCEKVKETGMYAYALDADGVSEITLPDVYSYTPVGALVSLPKIWMQNTVKVHAWTGSDGTEFTDEAGGEPEEMVYVTVSGSVYHKNAGCRYLDLSISQVAGSNISSLRNDNGEKYHACETCSKNQNPAGTVYITSTGNRYHNLASCSGLKRTVMLVKHSQVSEMHVCSKCG